LVQILALVLLDQAAWVFLLPLPVLLHSVLALVLRSQARFKHLQVTWQQTLGKPLKLELMLLPPQLQPEWNPSHYQK
jgi:hypothetical protein